MRNPLCVGAKVLLMHNFWVEHKIMNGSVGDHEHLNADGLECVIVDFP